MSWRAESTFKPASALADDEKDFLKLVKKVRDVQKLQQKLDSGEKLQPNQLEKVNEFEKILKDLAALGGRLPAGTEVLEKNQDVVQLLPDKAVETIMRKQRQAQDRAQQDEQRRQRKDEREREERNKPEFMTIHQRSILGCAVSRDGPGYIYTCSKDKFVLCWSLAKPKLEVVCTYAGHRGAVRSVDLSAAGHLVSGDSDGKIMLWDSRAPVRSPYSVSAPLQTIEDGGNVQVLRWCPFDAPAEDSGGKGYSDGKGKGKSAGPQRFASACEKLASKPAAIAVWRVDGRNVEQLLRLEDLPGKANDLRWAGGAKLKLLSCHDNGYVGVWAVEGAGSLLKTIKLHSKPIASLCLSADGKSLITASHDSSSKVVDISTPATETVVTYTADRPLNAVVVTPDYVPGTSGYVVVAGGRDPMLVAKSQLMEDEFEAKILDSAEGYPVAAARGHFGPVHFMAFIPWLGKDGAFATCSEDGFVRVADLYGSTLHSDVHGDV